MSPQQQQQQANSLLLSSTTSQTFSHFGTFDENELLLPSVEDTNSKDSIIHDRKNGGNNDNGLELWWKLLLFCMIVAKKIPFIVIVVVVVIVPVMIIVPQQRNPDIHYYDLFIKSVPLSYLSSLGSFRTGTTTIREAAGDDVVLVREDNNNNNNIAGVKEQHDKGGDSNSSSSKESSTTTTTMTTTTMMTLLSSSTSSSLATILPEMIVFDLDLTLWTPDTWILDQCPSIPIFGPLLDIQGNEGQGTVGLKVPTEMGPTVHILDGALEVLQLLYNNNNNTNHTRRMILSVASTGIEPRFSEVCLNRLEIFVNISLGSLFQYKQIGRTGQLSTDKTTHFRALQRQSGIPFDKMLFFDDCIWSDNVGEIYNKLGVIGKRTPHGLTMENFVDGLRLYQQAWLKKKNEKQ